MTTPKHLKCLISEKEFDLSDKLFELKPHNFIGYKGLTKDDVMTFIQLLKENSTFDEDGNMLVDIRIINKLAGKDLLSNGKQ